MKSAATSLQRDSFKIPRPRRGRGQGEGEAYDGKKVVASGRV